MSYEIEIKDIEPITVASMRYIGPVTNASRQFPNVFKSIRGRSSGTPFFCYHTIDLTTGIGEMDLCVPTAQIPNGNGVTLKELPRVKAVCLTHIGTYDTLPMAYETIHKYIQENELFIQSPWREVFIKGPGLLIKGNPNKYITEILFPLKER